MNKRTWIFIAGMVAVIGGGLLYRHFAQDVDSRGATRLMRAIEENDLSKTIKLLEGEDVNVRDKSGQTALFYAARHATDPKVIYRLIVSGADPLAMDKSGNTPLTVAAKYNASPAVVMALAKQGHKDPRQQANKDKALVRAAKYNTAEVIKSLLVAQASPAALGDNPRHAVAFLAENENLTEQEKAAYRQVMLVLEILEEREQFAKSMASAQAKPTEKKVADKEAKTPVKKETTKQVTIGKTQEPSTKAELPAERVPKEKQMSEAVLEQK